MDQVIQDNVQNKSFMGNVLVVKGDQVLFERSYGAANLEWAIPNNPATKFRLGSLTKQFTAAAILLLEERGKLKLDDPIRKYIPDAPAAWEKVTLFNLLTHTAGIPTPSFEELKAIMRRSLTPAELIALFKDKPLDFPVGEKWRYSNTGYILLGAVIEKAAGLPYAQFLQDNLFGPLGMKDTGYDSAAAIIPMRASGYALRNGRLENSDFIDMSIPYSAGSLYSTARDLLTWEQALYGGRVLKPASLKKMTTPFKENYAMGLDVRDDREHKRYRHNGGINGFATALAWYPDDRLAVVVLDNVENGDGYGLAQRLADVAFGRPVILPSERKEIALDPAVLDRYVGRYELMPGVVLAITRDGDHLFGEIKGQPKMEMFAEAPREFFTKARDSQISFVAEGDAAATAFILHQNGRNTTAKRLP